MLSELAQNEGLRLLLFTLLGTALIDTLSGVYAAWKGGSFDAKFLDAFIKGHVLFRVMPILILAIGSVSMPGETGAALFAAASFSVAAYEAATVKSIMENLSSAKAGRANVPDDV